MTGQWFQVLMVGPEATPDQIDKAYEYQLSLVRGGRRAGVTADQLLYAVLDGKTAHAKGIIDRLIQPTLTPVEEALGADASQRLVWGANALLQGTDHIEFRVPTPEKTPSPEWLEWRQALRDVVAGRRGDIPKEPKKRYV